MVSGQKLEKLILTKKPIISIGKGIEEDRSRMAQICQLHSTFQGGVMSVQGNSMETVVCVLTKESVYHYSQFSTLGTHG